MVIKNGAKNATIDQYSYIWKIDKACKNTCNAQYEKYKVSGEEDLKNANKFWKEIISR